MMRAWGTAQDGIGINQREGETLDERFDAASSGDRRALARLLVRGVPCFLFARLLIARRFYFFESIV